MPVSFDAVKVGDILWDCHKVRAGNTTMSRVSCFQVEVISKDERGAMCRWNGNPAKFYAPYRFKNLRRTKIETKRSSEL